MTDCCQDKECEVAALRESHGKVLWAVLAINAIMFVVEGYAGIVAHSTSLLADALDMLGDALVYGFSLLVLHRSAQWQARAAMAKGLFMLGFGLAVLAEAAHKALVPAMPVSMTMGLVAAMALSANLVCFALLYRHRADNLNMGSTWLCSRNDLIANAAVIAAAGATALLASRWPDIVVGVAIAALFLRSALTVIRAARAEMQKPEPPAAKPLRQIPIAVRRG